ncbi:hypothetical protein K461DRAFT_290401 [Myriangium duriaei CBS 260.36]|uniref:tRNA (adenine(58)-N(1))-methyltransferase non-catalytic subunit TRM6 n=1 Tax=Myriangium duriaei CBS 260.36 TaxID=1168546 RepID=A0A9P4JAS0_9PEZI|nr:hypothetical protein K461DRAFT_290401 [Myriangium duriaei CBS 260.36]
MSAFIQPHRHVVLRLPSDALKVVEIIPNTSISIGKFGSFPANLLLGRPFYTTYEIHEHNDESQASPGVRLRVVPASELNREAQFDTVPSSETEVDTDMDATVTPAEQAGDEEAVIVKDNRMTIDDASRQTLSMYEIEDLKKAVTGNGREIIERIMSAHKNLDEKTNFSLAKYTLRKAKKYLRRFTVLPVDVGRLSQYLTSNREASRIMELREESLGLVNAWSNVHVTPPLTPGAIAGKWLVIDDTGGLVVASVAEKLGILLPSENSKQQNGHASKDVDAQEDVSMQDAGGETAELSSNDYRPPHLRRHPYHPSISNANTIYVLHPASQPNMSLLKYFGYSTTHPDPSHPLSQHLLPLSWLQLLSPEHDSTYAEPPTIPQAELEQMKPSKRSGYHRKRRRWLRCKSIVDTARVGQFDGLICATTMLPASILRHLVPLIKGGGHVVLYSPTIEPLEITADLYSKERKAAFIAALDSWRDKNETPGGEREADQHTAQDVTEAATNGHDADEMPDPDKWRQSRLGATHLPEGFMYDEDDFPVDPRLLLGGSIHSSRARQWQVLPGRTHPVMTSRGGGDGYIFTARRVLPVEGKVEARGKFSKKRKTAPR